MQSRKVAISDIKVADRVRGASDLDDLRDSIRRWGLLQPILVDADMVLYDGYRRLEACKQLGWTEVDVYCKDDLAEEDYNLIELEANLRRKQFSWQETVEAVYRIHQAYSRRAALTGKSWTMEMTGQLIGGFSDSYVGNCLALVPMLAFDRYQQCSSITEAVKLLYKERQQEAAVKLAERALAAAPLVSIQQAVSPPAEAPRTASFYEPHLVLGDCRKVLREMEPESVDHIITDPPYGIDMTMLAQEGQTLIDTSPVEQHHQVDDNLVLLAEALPLMARVLKPTGFLVMWFDITRWNLLYECALAQGLRVQRWPVVWCKLTRCKNQAPEYNTTKDYELAMICRKAQARIPQPVITSIVTAGTLANKRLSNPFAKPFEAWRYFIENLTHPGELLLDPFAGEGSCVTAAMRLNRRVIGIEIDTAQFGFMQANVIATRSTLVEAGGGMS